MATTAGFTQQVIDEFVGASHGDLARAKELLAQHPDVLEARARWDETALGAAAHSGQKEIAEFLLSAGAPLDICTASMLGMASRVAAMLEADPRLAGAKGAHGIPVLFHAAIRGHKQVAELLLAHGTDVNAGAGGNTALHGAAMFGQTSMAEWLLARGADVNTLDYEGKTPLRQAVEHGHGDVADLLRRHGGTE